MKKLLLFLILQVILCSCKKTASEIIDGIGIYGDSIAALLESDSSKLYLACKLNIPIYTYARNGNGYSNLLEGSVPQLITGSKRCPISIL